MIDGASAGKRVRAAGGVLLRPAAAGPQVCLVHRQRYDDWSLPKGKAEPGEHRLATAVREIHEETGVRAQPLARLPRVAYRLPDGAHKTVDFWLMRPPETTPPEAALSEIGVAVGGPTDTDEVDEVRWLALPEAIEWVSYPDDAALLRHVAALPPITAAVPLVRHAHAGRRDAFRGEDAARPLDERGGGEAVQLAGVLELFDPRRLVSATPVRCRQTLEPLGRRIGLPILAEPAFDEPDADHWLPDQVPRAAARLVELAAGEPTVVCSQGRLIPSLLAFLSGHNDPDRWRTPKGTGWLLAFSGDRLATLHRL